VLTLASPLLLLPPLRALHVPLPLPLAPLHPRLARRVISISVALVVPAASSTYEQSCCGEGGSDPTAHGKASHMAAAHCAHTHTLSLPPQNPSTPLPAIPLEQFLCTPSKSLCYAIPSPSTLINPLIPSPPPPQSTIMCPPPPFPHPHTSCTAAAAPPAASSFGATCWPKSAAPLRRQGLRLA
jgi:hypothetical protein